MKTLSISNDIGQFSYKTGFKREQQNIAEPLDNKNQNKKLKITTLVTAAVAVASLGVASYAAAKTHKNTKYAEKEMDTLRTQIAELKQIIETNNDKSIVQSLTTKLEALEEKLANITKWYDGYLTRLNETVKEVGSRPPIVHVQGNANRYMFDFTEANLSLLQNIDNQGQALPLSDDAIKYLTEMPAKFINNKMPLRKLKPSDCLWNISTETKWNGTGGQGEIVTQFSKNAVETGLNFVDILPLHQLYGEKAYRLERQGDKWLYHCRQKEPLELKPFAEFQVNVARDGNLQIEKVTAFYCNEGPITKAPTIFINCPHYFTSQSLYAREATQSTEGLRYSGVFAKAVDALSLHKVLSHLGYADRSKVTVLNSEIMNRIGVPNAYYLQDWSAASIAGLARLKTPAEALNGELPRDVADWYVKQMNIIVREHNLGYQGKAWGQDASDIINTLFGKHAADIYRYAGTGFEDKNISRVLTTDNNFNAANIGLSLANFCSPVSRNEGIELATIFKRSGSLQHICDVRYQNGSFIGEGNPWDRSINQITESTMKGFNDNINKDLLTILKREVRTLNCPNEEAKNNLREVLEYLDKNEIEAAIQCLRRHANKITEWKSFIENLENKKYTKQRKISTYTHYSSLKDVVEARKQNKLGLIDYYRTMIEYNKDHPGTFNIVTSKYVDFSDITAQNIDDVVVLGLGARFTDQKGIDIAADTLYNVTKNWDKLHPGKPKPIFIVGGQDNTPNKHFTQMIKKTIDALGQDAQHIVLVDGWCPNNIIYAGSDFALFPSHYEPDGSTLEALYKGTLPLCTRVGGFIDRLSGQFEDYLCKNKIDLGDANYLNKIQQEYRELVMRNIDKYYTQSEKYVSDLYAATQVNYSWISRNSTNEIERTSGIAKELERLGYDLNSFENDTHKKIFELK